MDINDVVTAIEKFLATYDSPVEVQVRPSGDDNDVIKIWIDLGPRKVDIEEWQEICEAAIRSAIPTSKPYRLQVRAEND